ncbi:hypothetical protein [Novosphingobium sp.]|uniref:hypothetical protein n=1 Tax=Novosphingobium sp. TaxID=1874826 RepID=UPI0025EE3F70|nr:hypothetical protein [Novosphingobium sp.]
MKDELINPAGIDSGTSAILNRRTFVRGAVAAAGVGMMADLTGCGSGDSSTAVPVTNPVAVPTAIQATTYAIPDSAFVRTLGAVPEGICNTLTCNAGVGIPGLKGAGAGLSVPGLGLPLGGVGGGSMMINQCGTFGPWDMAGQPTTGNWEQRTLTQAAFHIREEVVGGSTGVTVKTLAVNHTNVSTDRRLGTVLPGWIPLNPGDGEYSVLFPFA